MSSRARALGLLRAGFERLGVPAPAQLLERRHVDRPVVEVVLDLGQVPGQDRRSITDGVPAQGHGPGVGACLLRYSRTGRRLGQARLEARISSRRRSARAWPARSVHPTSTSSGWWTTKLTPASSGSMGGVAGQGGDLHDGVPIASSPVICPGPSQQQTGTLTLTRHATGRRSAPVWSSSVDPPHRPPRRPAGLGARRWRRLADVRAATHLARALGTPPRPGSPTAARRLRFPGPRASAARAAPRHRPCPSASSSTTARWSERSIFQESQRGPFQSAHVGYWIDQAYAGRVS